MKNIRNASFLAVALLISGGSAFGGLWDDLTSAVSGTVSDAQKTVSSAVDQLTSAKDTFIESINDKIAELGLNDYKETYKAAFSQKLSELQFAAGSIKERIHAANNAALEAVKNQAAQAGQNITTKLAELKEFAQGQLAKVQETVSNIF